MKGMQDHGLLTTAKHFPGHGDTEYDSHKTLPVIDHDRDRLETMELFPFRELIDAGLSGIMVAHLYVPALDKSANTPTTLSPKVVHELLQDEMDFDGLVFTDALNMHGVTQHYQAGEADLMALEAGNDVLLFSQNVPRALSLIKKAIKEGRIKESYLDKKVRKILQHKQQLGLNQRPQVKTDSLYEDLHQPQHQALIEKLFAKAITLVENEDDFLPIGDIEHHHFASVTVGLGAGNAFQRMLDKYARFQHFQITDANAAHAHEHILAELQPGATVVVSFHEPYLKDIHRSGLGQASQGFLQKLDQDHNLIVVYMGNAYDLRHFMNQKALIATYEDNGYTRRLAPQAIFGALGFQGSLPIGTGSYDLHTGFKTKGNGRLGFCLPENVGMDSRQLARIDTIMDWTIDQYKATPGAQVLVARNGKVVFQKNYRHKSWFKPGPVEDETLYDVASVTKVAGTLQAVMFMVERGLVELDRKVAFYLPEFVYSNKADITVRDLLLHQAGLEPFIPFWRYTMRNEKDKAYYYREVKTDWYCQNVTGDFFTIPAMQDTLWAWTLRSKRKGKRRANGHYPYRYSDLSFYILKELAERRLGQPIEQFLQENYYDPLAMYHTAYNPVPQYDTCNIAPTEKDVHFRKTMLRGWVHDEFAALLGGVGGHAGLFSTAEDLAKLMQMHLNGGQYGGREYYLSSTLDTFTTRHRDGNRRGLGWDKPYSSGGGVTSIKASQRTYGHLGFTGTAVWADPEENLIYVFLSNRVHPRRNPNLSRYRIRPKIQTVLYDALETEQVVWADHEQKKKELPILKFK